MDRWPKRQRVAGGSARPSWNKTDASGEDNTSIGDCDAAVMDPTTKCSEVHADGAQHLHPRHHLFHRRQLVTEVTTFVTDGTQTTPTTIETIAASLDPPVPPAVPTLLPSVPSLPPFPSFPPLTVPVVPRATSLVESVMPSPATSETITGVPPTSTDLGMPTTTEIPSSSTDSSSVDPQTTTEPASTSPSPSDLVSPTPSPSLDEIGLTDAGSISAQSLPTLSSSSSVAISHTDSPSIATSHSDSPTSSVASSSGSSTLSATSESGTSTTLTSSKSSSVSTSTSGTDGQSILSPTISAESSTILAGITLSVPSSSPNSTTTLTTPSQISTTTALSSSFTFTTGTAETDSSTESSFISTSTLLPAETTVTSLGPGSGSGPSAPGSGGPPADPAAGNESAPSSRPPTPALVGGIVGGIAGLALILVALLFLLRWRKQKQRLGQPIPEGNSQRSLPSSHGQARGATTEITSQGALGAAAFFSRFRPPSQQTTTSSGTAPSASGFYRVSGRKIAPALSTGGDGYQGTTLSETSFYQDDGGFYGGPSGGGMRPMSDGGFSGRGSGGSEGEIVVMRPGPARTPVTSEGPSMPFPSPPVGSPMRRPQMDALGRSHPSHDGSRGSRFTEDVV